MRLLGATRHECLARTSTVSLRRTYGHRSPRDTVSRSKLRLKSLGETIVVSLLGVQSAATGVGEKTPMGPLHPFMPILDQHDRSGLSGTDNSRAARDARVPLEARILHLGEPSLLGE